MRVFLTTSLTCSSLGIQPNQKYGNNPALIEPGNPIGELESLIFAIFAGIRTSKNMIF